MIFHLYLHYLKNEIESFVRVKPFLDFFIKMSNNLLVCKSNWKAESGSLDNIYYIKPTETSDEEDKRYYFYFITFI